MKVPERQAYKNEHQIQPIDLNDERQTCNFCGITAEYCGVKRVLDGMQIKQCSKLQLTTGAKK